MGIGHGLSGADAGMATGAVLALSPVLGLILMTSGAGVAVLCDIDCKGSTVETAFGPLSRLWHIAAVEAHHTVCVAIGAHDVAHKAHRGLTHWWPSWLVMGGAVTTACATNRWVAPAILAVLFAVGIRALSIPALAQHTQARFHDSVAHRVGMDLAYWMISFRINPLHWLHRISRTTDRKRSIELGAFISVGAVIGAFFAWRWMLTTGLGGYGWWLVGATLAVCLAGWKASIRFPTGKILCAGASAGAAYALQRTGYTAQIGPWLGLMVTAGCLLHWLGDCPTHMGVPGLWIGQVWKLPHRLSFAAGGPFEVFALWFPLGFLGVFLLLGTAGAIPHYVVMFVITCVGIGLGALIVLAILIHVAAKTKQRRYAK